jgi:hypothetical protein
MNLCLNNAGRYSKMHHERVRNRSLIGFSSHLSALRADTRPIAPACNPKRSPAFDRFGFVDYPDHDDTTGTERYELDQTMLSTTTPPPAVARYHGIGRLQTADARNFLWHTAQGTTIRQSSATQFTLLIRRRSHCVRKFIRTLPSPGV